MNRILLAIVCLTVAVHSRAALAQMSRNAEDRVEAAKFGWVFDYKKGREVARKTDRPMMVVFRCVP